MEIYCIYAARVMVLLQACHLIRLFQDITELHHHRGSQMSSILKDNDMTVIFYHQYYLKFHHNFTLSKYYVCTDPNFCSEQQW